MKALRYEGFLDQPCLCQYAVGTVAGATSIVFVQGRFVQGGVPQTTITNLIEVLASKVLCGDPDLKGIAPQTVRFFEHYPAYLEPLRDWQEVVFEEHEVLARDKGLLAKLLNLVTAGPTTTLWVVSRPVWSPVAPEMIPALKSLIV